MAVWMALMASAHARSEAGPHRPSATAPTRALAQLPTVCGGPPPSEHGRLPSRPSRPPSAHPLTASGDLALRRSGTPPMPRTTESRKRKHHMTDNQFAGMHLGKNAPSDEPALM